MLALSLLTVSASFEPILFLMKKVLWSMKGLVQIMAWSLRLKNFSAKDMLMTTSLYESTYEGSDGIKRNTAFNNNYIYNLLFGEEWKLGWKAGMPGPSTPTFPQQGASIHSHRFGGYPGKCRPRSEEGRHSLFRTIQCLFPMGT